jgi:pantetheine-phosphate adenylyltransferase
VTTALYPGSFDPLHLGHVHVVEQAAGIFDEVVVAVLGNAGKHSGLLAMSDRVRLAKAAFARLGNVRCIGSDGFTVDVARREGAQFIIRSAHKDLAHEHAMAGTNNMMSGIRTVFAKADPTTAAISSTLVRDLVARGEIDRAVHLVPHPVGEALRLLA